MNTTEENVSFEHFDLEIDEQIQTTKTNQPINTVKTYNSIWNHFVSFCNEKGYNFDKETDVERIALILKDWAINMKKANGEEYKEGVIKIKWNITAKKLQELYFERYNIIFDPFKDTIFKSAREARNTKRKQLQLIPTKRKSSFKILNNFERQSIINLWDENTPFGLQRKLFHIMTFELAWRGGEATKCLIHHFKEEVNRNGLKTGRIEYNPDFSKSTLDNSQKRPDSKWLQSNPHNPNICPVRIFRKYISKRGSHISSVRFFLACNSYWNIPKSLGWYKNCPVGKNEIAKWKKEAARKIGLDSTSYKISSHKNTYTRTKSGNELEYDQRFINGNVGPFLNEGPDLEIDLEENMDYEPTSQIKQEDELKFIPDTMNIPNSPTNNNSNNFNATAGQFEEVHNNYNDEQNRTRAQNSTANEKDWNKIIHNARLENVQLEREHLKAIHEIQMQTEQEKLAKARIDRNISELELKSKQQQINSQFL